MDDNTQFSERQSIGSTPSSHAKTDPAWEHFSSSRDIDGKVCYTYLYCNNSFKGGGINRMKYHLAGIKGQISQYEWWKLCGSSAPTLQKIAIRILGQTASSLGCERNWSVFERIHTQKKKEIDWSIKDSTILSMLRIICD
ncbi:uncharacterized protein LOC111381908 [Olea europaea var. sylvestris]|uniref:uncharacterized protein LOC111381908 n=1 Tax=Olea europaea var. sylvestris TaxID=158386 RepID=UPI000C1D5696|nr:uncharacterized protein LOC111381908 [Olea europaea var. sylvestris]